MTTRITSGILANTAVTPGVYGSTTQHTVITVDQQGRITLAANAVPSIATTQLTGTISSAQLAAGVAVANLGFTPYNSTNPSGYQTSSGSVASATLASKASTLSQGGGNGTAMTFNWSGQGGQPTWLWGSNDGTNHYVYNPSNFNVNSAGTANALNTGNSYQIASLGVNTAAPGGGAIRATGDITGFYSSDEKFKENIQPITNAVDAVVAINGKTFDWTDEYINTHGGEDGYFVQKSDFGVIAQDVQKVFPLAVRTREDGSLAVDYAKLSALAFAAIADLQKQINELKGQ
jgi:hypothetical protein